jgi:hypothetical protein
MTAEGTRGYTPMETEFKECENGTHANGNGQNGQHDKAQANKKHAAAVGAAKAASILMKIEKLGYVGVPADSCYGAAVAIPQVARSSGWTMTYLGLSIRVYIFLAVTFSLQLFLLAMIRVETHTMESFAGQMHLCDFGKTIQDCPNAPNCRGPGGTVFTYPRLYDYDTWALRSFVRDSLKSIFPEKAEEIHAKADPGEFGLENYYCRLVCVFIFMMSVVDDLKESVSLVMLLYTAPTRDDMWIEYKVPEWADKDYIKKVRDFCELDLVTFRVAGMPIEWKIFNFMFVAAPKMFIWITLCTTGFHFLMETSTIVDVIVNSVALKFILDLDGLILSHLATHATRYIVHNLESMELFDKHEHEHESEFETTERFYGEEKHLSGWSLYNLLFPKRLGMICFLTCAFVIHYYLASCILLKDGSWVSRPMHVLGAHSTPGFAELIFGIAPAESEELYWSMPAEDA